MSFCTKIGHFEYKKPNKYMQITNYECMLMRVYMALSTKKLSWRYILNSIYVLLYTSENGLRCVFYFFFKYVLHSQIRVAFRTTKNNKMSRSHCVTSNYSWAYFENYLTKGHITLKHTALVWNETFTCN